MKVGVLGAACEGGIGLVLSELLASSLRSQNGDRM